MSQEFGDPIVEATQGSPDADAALGYGPEPTVEQAPAEGDPADEQAQDWDGEEVDETAEAEVQPEEEQPKKYFGKWNSEEEADKGVKNLYSTLGRQSNELGQLRQQNQALQQQMMQLVAAAQYAQQQAYSQPAPAQPTPQKVDPQAWWEKATNDPHSAIAEVIQPTLQQALQQQQAVIGAAMQQYMAQFAPILQQQQMMQVQGQLERGFREQAEHLALEYPDVAEYVDAIKAQVDQNPQVLMIPGALEKLYKAAKADAITSGQAAQRSAAAKKAARMPQSNAGRVQTNSHDKIVDDLLGPSGGGGEWG
jgi:hypothetical protein